MEFREMRRKRQQLSDAECVGILENATSGTLALQGDGGYPYAVPISYVHADGKLYFHSALKGHKVDAIRGCDKASFCVIEQDEVHGEEYTTYFRSVVADERSRHVCCRFILTNSMAPLPVMCSMSRQMTSMWLKLLASSLPSASS